MNIPIMAEVVLGILGSVLILMRLSLGSGRKKREEAGYDYGACKTIGDREIQGDDYGLLESGDAILAVLSDGSGSGYGGKIASRCAVEAFLDLFCNENAFYNPQYYFRKAFHAANREILNYLDGERGEASVAAAILKNRTLYYAVVGNVKIAVYRNEELIPVTAGHTIGVLAEQKYREGRLTKQEAVSLLEHHRLYNYVGQDGFRDIEFFDMPLSLHAGEYVVILSGGMQEGVSWKEIEDCLSKEGSCQDKALELVETINRKLGEDMDNAAIVILRVK